MEPHIGPWIVVWPPFKIYLYLPQKKTHMLLIFFLQKHARWLTDLDTFNEWMNELDYEAEGSSLLNALSPLLSFLFEVTMYID